ncbi:MAG: hypothetical protein ACXVYA_10625, partial [Mycobacterium sp.]
MRPLVHRLGVIDPLLEDHRVHLPVWSVVSLAWTNRLCRARPAGAPGHQCAVVNDQHYVAAQTPGGPRTWQVMASTSQLRQGLSQRQLSMIALGGVIGAGLFVGSGVVIKDTGPAAFLTYALCGVLIVLVMRMLGE